jgi:hypothetical protein
MVPGEARGFSVAEMDAAKKWVSEETSEKE